MTNTEQKTADQQLDALKTVSDLVLAGVYSPIHFQKVMDILQLMEVLANEIKKTVSSESESIQPVEEDATYQSNYAAYQAEAHANDVAEAKHSV